MMSSMRPKNLSEHEMVDLIDYRCRHQGQAALARSIGSSPQMICDIRKGRKVVSASVARGLGYRRVVRYEPIA